MTKLLRLPAVMERTALSRSKIYELLSTNEFPRPVKLAGGRVNAWPEPEIEAFNAQLIANREVA
jgi:prophage regulatory protein